MKKTIYVISNQINNKKYVGQTKNLDNRIEYHNRDKDRNRFMSPLYEELNKYGPDYFMVEVLEVVDDEVADIRERYWIDELNTMYPSGYNLTTGGEHGKKYSDITKERIGRKTKERWNNPEIAKRMKEGLRKSGLAQRGKFKSRRVLRKCRLCSKWFRVIQTNPQKYCSKRCSAHSLVGLTAATKSYVKKRSVIKKDIHDFSVDWAIRNAEIINNTPFNKISTNLEPMIVEINEKFDVKDFRVISSAICGIDSRKEMLKYLKSIVNK